MRHNNSNITIRQLTATDFAAVNRLAQLDTRAAPSGHLLGAEVDGTLLAAISLSTGAVVADPFSRTAELRSLLELRAGQIGRRQLPVRGLMRRRHASAPAPAGGLLSLHPRAS